MREDILEQLQKSPFRRQFHLRQEDKNYIQKKGIEVIRHHAEDFISKRLAPAFIANDGRQTPMRHHPVFIAQHATATCCRQCLYKWHKIPAGRELSSEEQLDIVNLIMKWIEGQIK